MFPFLLLFSQEKSNWKNLQFQKFWTKKASVINKCENKATHWPFHLFFYVQITLKEKKQKIKPKALYSFWDYKHLQHLTNGKMKDKKNNLDSYLFIRSIRAIHFTIATPFWCNAILFRTLKLFNRIAHFWWTFCLITTITTIVISITNPSILNTSAIITRKLVRAASIIWKS